MATVQCKGYNSRGDSCGQLVDLDKHPDGFCGLCKGSREKSGDELLAGAPPDLMAIAAGTVDVSDEEREVSASADTDNPYARAYAIAQNDQDRALISAMEADAPVIVWGLPGIGKSAMIASVAEAMGAQYEVVIASQNEPADIVGQPYVTDGEHLTHLVPPWAARLMEADKEGRPGILFLDELDKAPIAAQNAALRVARERVVGDKPLGRNVRVVAAANPPEMGGWDLTAPMANRFIHLNFKVDNDVVIRGIQTGSWGGKPSEDLSVSEELRQARVKWRSMVAGFLSRNPDQIHVLPKNESEQGKAWPSPRTWDELVHALAVAEMRGYTSKSTVMARLCEGAVGRGAATEFRTWVDKVDLPDPEDILRDPTKAPVPDRPDQLLVSINSVVGSVISRPSQDRVDSVFKFLRRVQDGGRTEWAAPALTQLAGWLVAPDTIRAGIKPPQGAEDKAMMIDLVKKFSSAARISDG
jgi:MoxR-like ATPase